MKRGTTIKTIFFAFLIVLALLSSQTIHAANDAQITLGDGDKILWCSADGTGICTTGAAGNEYYDNTDFFNTYDPYITIDDCTDGATSIPFEGMTYEVDIYEYVQKIEIDDLNATKENPNITDAFLRSDDYIKVSVYFMCYDGDYFSVFYKNNTGVLDDWKLLTIDVCDMSGIKPVEIEMLVDDVAGNHTIRSMIAYNMLSDMDYCGYDVDPDYADTDDIIFEVVQKLDKEEPMITVTPADGTFIEYNEGQVIEFVANISDQTGVDFVNITLTHNNITIPISYSENGELYHFNFTNLTSLGLYEIGFYANDTIRTNDTLGTYNHFNNYTKSTFYLKDDVNINIITPSFNTIFSYGAVLLDLVINDPGLPYNEVYYLLNNGRVNLTETKYVETISTTDAYVNNSAYNLSQSFRLSENTNSLQLDLLIKRFGNNQSISNIILTDNSSSPIGTLIATSNMTGISNETFTWVAFSLNQTANLAAGTNYWVTLILENNTDFILWAYNNTYTGGASYSNSSIDLGLRIHDANAYNATLSSIEGFNTLQICENNSISNIGCGYTQYYVDLTPPYFVLPISYTSQVELGDVQTITADVKDAISPISKVLLSFNNTNITLNLSGGKYPASLNLSLGAYNFSIFANDSKGWSNTTITYSFTVNDTKPPSSTLSSVYPNTTELLDPNTTITINFTLSDKSNITQATLQYRTNTTAVWTNVSATRISNIYTAQFTPANDTLYYYRIYAKDYHNNSNYSKEYNLSVLYERLWTYTPLLDQIDTVFMSVGEEGEIYNFTISNTGDVPLLFNLSKHSSTILALYFSNQTFNLSNGENITLFVNSTAPPIKNIPYKAYTKITCLSGCQQQEAATGGSVVVQGDGPFLELKLVYVTSSGGEESSLLYNLPYYDGRTFTSSHRFRAIIENLGTIAADNITFRFDFTNTSMWIKNITNPLNLTANFSLAPLGQSGNKKTVDIIFYIDYPVNRSIFYNLNASTSFTYNLTEFNDSKYVDINVTKFDQTAPQETCSNGIDDDYDGQVDEGCTPSSPGGGGTTPAPSPSISPGGSSPGGGMGLGGGLTLTYNMTVYVDKNVDLMRGSNKTIQVNITNPYKNKYFSGIELDVSGYYKNHISISPSVIGDLDFNKTRTINITFNAPSYFGYSVNKVELKFNYLAVSTGQNASTGEEMSSSSFFNLIVNEVSREDSIGCLEESAYIVKNATLLGYNVDGLKSKFDEQKKSVFGMDFTRAEQLCEEIKNDYESIIGYEKKISELGIMINQSIIDGYELSDVSKLYGIAMQEFSDGEYDKLASSIKDVETAYALQINVEDANIFKRLKKFIFNNFKWIMIALAVLGVVSYFAYLKVSAIVVKNKIIDLEKEKIQIDKYLKDLQNKYFMEKSVSPDYFTLHMEKNKDRLAGINEELLHYKSLSSKLENKSGKIESLEDTQRKIKQAMTDVQNKYFVDKTMDKKSYERMISNYNHALMQTKKDIIIAQKKEERRKKSKIFQFYNEKIIPLIKKNQAD